MMYLIDTNVWLERLLDQERSDEVGKFLDCITSNQLFVTDFTLHSIAVIMTRLKQAKAFIQFIDDAFINGSVSLIHLPPEESKNIVQVMSKYNMDFDDAYQYVTAEKYNLTIVSFDNDFDKTSLGKKFPMEIINAIQK